MDNVLKIEVNLNREYVVKNLRALKKICNDPVHKMSIGTFQTIMTLSADCQCRSF